MPANSATNVAETRAKARDKSVTRLSILEAARRLAAERGTDSLSLGAVAVEAGFARATVYGYFKSKNELLQALAAYDLAQLAGAMNGDGEWVNPAEEDATSAYSAPPAWKTDPDGNRQTIAAEQSTDAIASVEVPEPEDAVEPPFIVPAEISQASEEAGSIEDFATSLLAGGAAPDPVAHVEEGDTSPFVTTRVDINAPLFGEPKSELDKILSKLTSNDPVGSEGSAAAMARFDRRLRVVERTVAELQSHQQQAEKSTSTSVDSVAESLRGINQRLEEAERRQREAFAELRASAREAARRLGALEKGKPASVEVSEPGEEPTPVPLPDLIEPIEDVVPESAAGTNGYSGKAEPESANASVTYLAAARNSARLAAETSRPEKQPKSWLYRIPRKYLMFACAMMSVVTLAIGVLVVQRASALAARADTISPEATARAVVHRPIAPRRLAVVSPLDELSALAASGNGKAQLIVGLKYLKGNDGIAKNPVEAAKWIARAAQRGEPMAQYWSGYIYQHGVGVSTDPDAALRWYEAAADQGNTKAMYNLGVGYAQGWAGAKDAPEASRWFARAARLGYVDAQFNLAVLYERGLGVPPNLSDAYKWYAIAAKSGDAESKKRLDALATQLSGDDLAAAQRSVLMFRPTPAVVEANTLPTIDSKRT